jgi:hypothetical protein
MNTAKTPRFFKLFLTLSTLSTNILASPHNLFLTKTPNKQAHRNKLIEFIQAFITNINIAPPTMSTGPFFFIPASITQELALSLIKLSCILSKSQKMSFKALNTRVLHWN